MTEMTNLAMPRLVALAADWSSQMQKVTEPFLAFTQSAQAATKPLQAFTDKWATLAKDIAAGMERELADGTTNSLRTLREGASPAAVAARCRAHPQVAAMLTELETQPIRSYLVLEVMQCLLSGDTGTASKWLRMAAKLERDALELRLLHLLQRLIDQLLHIVTPALPDWGAVAELKAQQTITAAPMRELHQPPLLKRIQSYLADAQLGTVARAALCA